VSLAEAGLLVQRGPVRRGPARRPAKVRDGAAGEAQHLGRLPDKLLLQVTSHFADHLAPAAARCAGPAAAATTQLSGRNGAVLSSCRRGRGET